MWEDATYCWVVLCKNHWFHMRQSFLARHRILLAETDAVASLPPLPKYFTVRCDECRKTYTYRPSDVLRSELEVPESFRPHPLFREEPEAIDSDRSKEQQEKPRQVEPSREGRQEEPPPKERTATRRITQNETNASQRGLRFLLRRAFILGKARASAPSESRPASIVRLGA